MGWFLKEQDIQHCEWTASEKDMEYPEHPKGAVIFNYEQTFGGYGASKKVEKGINFTSIRFQRLHVSPLIIQETGGNKEMIGTFDHPIAKQLFDEDKENAAKESDYKRKYTVRTMYCVYVLTKDNKRAHNKPLVLSIKGLNGVDLGGRRIIKKVTTNAIEVGGLSSTGHISTAANMSITSGGGLEVAGQSTFKDDVYLGDSAAPGNSVLRATQGMLLISSAVDRVFISSDTSDVQIENTIFDGDDNLYNELTNENSG